MKRAATVKERAARPTTFDPLDEGLPTALAGEGEFGGGTAERLGGVGQAHAGKDPLPHSAATRRTSGSGGSLPFAFRTGYVWFAIAPRASCGLGLVRDRTVTELSGH